MKIAFYYHVPYVLKGEQLYIASYLGVFIDALAQQVDELTLLVHQDPTNDTHFSDYLIQAQNIRIVRLGVKQSALKRTLFGGKLLKKSLNQIADCDALIVRGPSPLANKFQKYTSVKICYLLVGDYGACATEIQAKTLKQRLLAIYFNYVDRQLVKVLRNNLVVVNSIALADLYQSITPNLHVLKTSTLVDEDYYLRPNFALQQPIQIVYTGRIEATKGLFELVQSIATLNESQHVHLKIVGWESDSQKPVERALCELATQLNIQDAIEFTGKMRIGVELNSAYRSADIFVIPSYHEGFPRVIWEAMANSAPVIATRVGGIPYFLEDQKHALLIAPKSTEALTAALKRLIEDEEFRSTIAKNGFELAQENRVSTQAEKLIQIVSKK